MSKERRRSSGQPVATADSTSGSSQASAGAADQANGRDAGHAAIVTLDEAAEQYEGEWVLMRVTGKDPETHVSFGEVLLHHPSRRAISQALRQAHKQDPQVHLAVFPGGIQQRSYEETMALMDRAARGPYVNAHW